METEREIELIPFDEEPLGALKDLVPDGQTLATLRRDLRDGARGHGRQAVIALEHGKPAGVAGWVALGVETEGIVYGSPVLARTEPSAMALLDRLAAEARALDAHQFRVTLLPKEEAKKIALGRSGFHPLLDMITVERPSTGLPEAALPPELTYVPAEHMDWGRFAEVYNRVFAEVPNAPPVDGASKREEWGHADREASGLWEDAAGRYVAWIAVHPDGDVDEVGVDASLRGRGVAPALYHRAGEAMARSGVPRLRAMLASTNTATLRLHAKLGFQESARRTVFALDLAPAGREV